MKEIKPAKVLQPISIARRADGQVVPIKYGAFGGQGSGKSFTAACLAIGLSINLHDRAPVFIYDTEPGWQFFSAMFKTEGVEMIQRVGQNFDGLRQALQGAESAGACVFAGDSYTHIWMDLMRSFMSRGGYVEFNDWNQIKPAWREWTVEFLNSPMHCLALGRLGWNYIPQENERRAGKIEFIKSDSKFNAGGGESFGYEPHILVEMEAGRQHAHNGRGGEFIYRANVLKDRAQILNGEQFTFYGLRQYKQGDYAAVWNALAPHVQAMQQVPAHILIPAGATAGSRQYDLSCLKERDRERTILCEELQGTLVKLWPSQDGASKRAKAVVLEEVFNTRSWTKVESLALRELEAGLLSVYALEERLKTEQPTDEAMLTQMLRLAKEDVSDSAVAKCGRAAAGTALESLLTQSVETVKGVSIVDGEAVQTFAQTQKPNGREKLAAEKR